MMMDRLKGELLRDMQKFAGIFQATHDLKWMVKYAERAALHDSLYKKSKGLALPRIETFRTLLRDPAAVRSGKDKVQHLLSALVGRTLDEYYAKLSDNQPAIKTLVPGPPAAVLEDELVPSGDELEELNRLFIQMVGKLELHEEYQDALLGIAQDYQKFSQAVNYTLTMAYLSLLKQTILRNPVLLIIPPQDLMAKQAVKKIDLGRPGSPAPRLDNAIWALDMTDGQLQREYNEYVLYRLLGDTEEGLRFFGEPKGNHASDIKGHRRADAVKGQLDRIPKMIAAAHGGYAAFFRAIQASYLNWINVDEPELSHARRRIRVDSRDPEFITDNPPVKQLQDGLPESIMDYFVGAEIFRNMPDLEVTRWDGEKVSPSLNISDQDLTKYFFGSHDSPDFHLRVTTNLNKRYHDTSDFAALMQQNKLAPQLADTLQDEYRQNAIDIYTRIVDTLRLAVNTFHLEKQELADSAWDEADTRWTEDTPGSWHDDDATNMKAYNAGLLQVMAQASDGLTEVYSAQVDDPLALKRVIDTIAVKVVMPLSPYTSRYLHNANYRVSRKPFGDKIKPGMAAVFNKVVSSPTFYEQVKASQQRANVYQIEHKSDFVDQIKEGVERLKTEQSGLLEELGITSRHFEQDSANAQTEDGKLNRGKLLDLTGERIGHIFAYAPESLQEALGDIPLDSLYAYLAEKQLSTTGAALRESAVRRMGFRKTKEDKAYAQGGSGGGESKDSKGAAIDRFYNETFSQIKESRDNHGRPAGDFSPRTMAGLLKQYHGTDKDITMGAWLNNGFTNSFGNELYVVADRVLSELEHANAADPSVTDDNWDDPSNPRPRKRAETAHVTGAFADPRPNDMLATKQRESVPFADQVKGRAVRPPGKLLTIDQSYDTPRQHINRVLARGGYRVESEANVIEFLRREIDARRVDIKTNLRPSSVSPEEWYSDDELRGFDIDKDKSYAKSSFVEGVNNSTGQTFSKKDALMFLASIPSQVMTSSQIALLRNRIRGSRRSGGAFDDREIFSSYLENVLSQDLGLEPEIIDRVMDFYQSSAGATLNPTPIERQEPVKPKREGADKQLAKLEGSLNELTRIMADEQTEQLQKTDQSRYLQRILDTKNRASSIKKSFSELLLGVVSKEQRQRIHVGVKAAADLVTYIDNVARQLAEQAQEITETSLEEQTRIAATQLQAAITQTGGAMAAEGHILTEGAPLYVIMSNLQTLTTSGDWTQLIDPTQLRQMVEFVGALRNVSPERLQIFVQGGHLQGLQDQIEKVRIGERLKAEQISKERSEIGIEKFEPTDFTANDKYYYI